MCNQKNKTAEYNIAVQSVRGIACLLVFLSHCYSVLDIKNEYVLSLCQDAGRLGVLTFFLLSGLLYSNRSFCQRFDKQLFRTSFSFMLRKIKKIYLLYLISTIAMMAVTFNSYIVPEWQDNWLNLLARVILHLLLLQSFVPKLGVAYAFNGPAWFLSVCILLWLCTPTISLLTNKIKKDKSVRILSVLLFLLQCVYLVTIYNMHLVEQRWFMYVNPFFNLTIYAQGLMFRRAWGDLLNQLSEKIEHRGGGTAGVLSVVEVLSTTLLLILYAGKNIIPVDFRVISWEIPSMVFLYCVVYGGKEKLNSFVGKLPFRIVGNISMEIYLFHYLILNIVEPLEFNGIVKFAVIFCLTIFLAFIIQRIYIRRTFSA